MNGISFAFMVVMIYLIFYGIRRNNYRKKNICPKHNHPWCASDDFGRRYCMYYDPYLGASEDYGCPQED